MNAPKCYGCAWYRDMRWTQTAVVIHAAELQVCMHRSRPESLVDYTVEPRNAREARADPNDCGPEGKWREEPQKMPERPPFVETKPKKRGWFAG